MTGNVAVLLGLLALVFLGAWGWGRAARGLLRRRGWSTVDDVLDVPQQLLLGFALFLSAGGFFVALGIARFGVLLGWQVLGVAFLVPRLPAWIRHVRGAARRSILRGAAVTAAAGALGFLALGQAVGGLPRYNAYDDDAAYVYLAKRLLATGGLDDPFNLRRITSFGGSELYQALFLRATGNSSLRAFELVFALGLVLVVAVGSTARRWLVPGILVLGAALVLGHGVGPVVNLSPEFSVAALSLGVYALLRRVPLVHQEDQSLLYAVVGVLLAGILALRSYYLVSVVLATLFVLVALRGRRSLRAVVVTAATAGVASIGWSVALARSSGTPLFQLLAGNYDTAWPSGDDPWLHGLGAHAGRFLSAFNGDAVGWVCLVAVALAAVHLATGRTPTAMIVLLGAGLGCLAQVFLVSYVFSGSSGVDVTRFVAPSTLACALLVVDAVWPRRHGLPTGPAAGRLLPHGATAAPGRSGAALARRLAAASTTTAGVVVVAVGTVALASGSPAGGYAKAFSTTVRQAGQVLDGSAPLLDRFAPYEHDYAALNAWIPSGAKVLAAVDRPGLLDFSRFTFVTLDSAGAVSPPPHMPYFDGAAAKVAYLRRLGYGYIVSDSPAQRGLYYFRFFEQQLRQEAYFFRAQAAYYIDWQSTVTSLERSGRYPVRRSGPLTLIRIS